MLILVRGIIELHLQVVFISNVQLYEVEQCIQKDLLEVVFTCRGILPNDVLQLEVDIFGKLLFCSPTHNCDHMTSQELAKLPIRVRWAFVDVVVEVARKKEEVLSFMHTRHIATHIWSG